MPNRDPNYYLEGMDLVKELDQEVVSRLGLAISNEAMAELGFDDRLEKKRQIADALSPLITDVWKEGYGFVVVCAGEVYAGNDPVDFDLKGLASTTETHPIFLHRPAAVN